MADWTDFLPSMVRAPIVVYQNKENLNKWWKQLLVWAGRGETNVVVTGAAGSGKTVLTTSLHGEVKDYEWQEPGASTLVERYAISLGDWTKIFSVIPGQDIASREVGLNEAFNSHKGLHGVIHLVDYGFTSSRSEVGDQNLIADGVTSIEDIRIYNMQKELDEFKRVCDLIVNACVNKRGPKWFVIAVNKVDLYLDRIDDAKRYYHPEGQGVFVNELKRLLQRVGTNQLKIRVVPLCPKPKPFEWNGDKVIPQLSSFDEPANFMKNFAAIVAEASNGK
ncbi:hypothetical protein [Aeromonas veronii]|uniref:hypothetical protein n=1 Tax=Aeromonas veronii TaxID=654 RepID=UPI003B9F9DD9